MTAEGSAERPVDDKVIGTRALVENDLRAQAAIAVNVSTKSQAAYEQVRRLILEGHLRPGSLIRQDQLAARLGLSTTPLREALRRLDGEHLVAMDAHRHVKIAPLSMRELDEIYFVRLRLDCLAASMAADRMSAADIEHLRHLASLHVGSEPLSRLERNQSFHRAVYAASGNAILTEILDALWDRGERYRMVLMHKSEDIESADEEHTALIDALADRDHDRVDLLMRMHLSRSQEAIRTRLRESSHIDPAE